MRYLLLLLIGSGCGVWDSCWTAGFSTQVLLTRHNSYHPINHDSTMSSSSSSLQMGSFWDRLTGTGDQEGAFVKLNPQDGQEFGPGPLIVLYNIPDGVTNDEIADMMADGAPQAYEKGITLYRIRVDDDSDNDNDAVLDMSMQDALQGIAKKSLQDRYQPAPPGALPAIGMPPIVMSLFSGFRNDEMLQAFQILSSECYQEAQISPACAKAVPKAMEKTLRQVIEEIGGDHREATRMMQEQQQEPKVDQ
jgi:hypothetical protein